MMTPELENTSALGFRVSVSWCSFFLKWSIRNLVLARSRPQQPDAKRDDSTGKDHRSHVDQGDRSAGLSGGRRQHREEEPPRNEKRGQRDSNSDQPKQGRRPNGRVPPPFTKQRQEHDHTSAS